MEKWPAAAWSARLANALLYFPVSALTQEEGFGGEGGHWSSGSVDKSACSLLKERRLENKRAAREGRRPRKVSVVWRHEMIWKKGLEGVTEKQFTIKRRGEDKDIHVREA